MNRNRVVLGAVGVVAFLLGTLTVLAPGTAALLPVDGLVAALGGPWVFVATFAVVAVAVVVAVLLARGFGGIDESTPPDPDDVYEVPHPGAEFDAFVDGRVAFRERLLGNTHERIRERLGMTALSTLQRAGLSRDEARQALASGTWTDDDAAAAFLSSRRTPSLRERLVAAVRGESAFQYGARRAAEELARLEGGERL